MRRRYLIEVCLFIITYIVISTITVAQTVTFSALDSILRTPVKLDSVIIENIMRQKDTTLIGINNIDLSTIKSSVINCPQQYPNIIISENYPNSFESDTKFSIYLAEESNLTLILINLLGQRLTEFNQLLSSGGHSFLLDGSSLSFGAYFIIATNGIYYDKMKIIKMGNSIGNVPHFNYLGSISNSNANKFPNIQLGDVYNFIGFSNGYRNDSLFNISPKNNDSIQFVMLQNPILDVTGGYFYISGVVDSMNNGTYILSDSLSFGNNYRPYHEQWSCLINRSCIYECFDCLKKYSLNDTLNLCNVDSYYNGDLYNMSVTSASIKIEIDTINHVFKEFFLTLCSQYCIIGFSNHEYGSKYLIYHLKNLPYTEISGNIYSVTLDSVDLTQNLINVTKCSSSDTRNYSDTIIISSYYSNLIKILDATKATLRINLYKR